VEELVRHGETGLIAAPGNAAAIAEALAQLMREPELRERMGQDGNIRVRTFFQAGPSADQIVRLLRSAMM
jgi:glycosyltransferase involved in cell wall biosynthesis